MMRYRETTVVSLSTPDVLVTMQIKSLLSISTVVVAALVPSTKTRAESLHIISGPDSLEIAELRPNRMERNCKAVTDNGCRVLRSYSADEIRAKLAAKTPVWRDGNDITFATDVAATSVDLSGGLQYPMSKIAGTNLWVVTLRAQRLDEAVISYFFIPEGPGITRPARFVPNVWRGPKAPSAQLVSVNLHGRIVADTLQSNFLAKPRDVVTYIPPARNNEPIKGVVYLGDGGSVRSLAAEVDTLIMTGALPRIALVGIASAMPKAGDPQEADPRAMEYLWDFEPGNARFIAHQNFFLTEVIPWAERTYGVPSAASSRAVWGISNSAGWAIQMGLRHPQVIGNVIAFSPGGSSGEIHSSSVFSPAARFFLQGGTLEPAFHGIAKAWGDSLKVRGVKHEVHEVIAGHDWEVWKDRFPEALKWAFGK